MRIISPYQRDGCGNVNRYLQLTIYIFLYICGKDAAPRYKMHMQLQQTYGQTYVYICDLYVRIFYVCLQKSYVQLSTCNANCIGSPGVS